MGKVQEKHYSDERYRKFLEFFVPVKRILLINAYYAHVEDYIWPLYAELCDQICHV